MNIRSLSNNDWLNLFMLIIALSSLIVAFASLIVAIDAEESAKHSEEISLQSLKWIKEPQPFMSYSSNTDYINGRINIGIYPFYYEGVTNESFMNIANYATPIKLTLYNSGMAPLMSPKLFINLTADKINNTFPFKISKVVTPLDKMYYDERWQTVIRSFEYMGKKFNLEDIRENDYPPHFIKNKVYYTNIVSSHLYMVEAEEQKDIFGPFMIGTIEPGNKVEVELWLFAIADEKNFDQTGNLTLLIVSDKIISPTNYNYNLTLNFPIRAKSGSL